MAVRLARWAGVVGAVVILLTPWDCAKQFSACKCVYEGGQWQCEGYGPKEK